uniref:Uncharacterized protein n=1 Tax=Tetraselmis sp. GSL018 TaxID=582737 RepID=A0A061RI94_9CHLO
MCDGASNSQHSYGSRTGSHRKLYLNVTATLTPEGVDNFQQLGTTCRAKVQLELPPGLFFDGYEVEREAAVRGKTKDTTFPGY